MAAFERVYKYRYLLLIWTVLEVLFFSAIVYGWAALVVVLKQESFFHDLCADENIAENHTSNTDDCIKQDERLNLVFLSGVISFSGAGVLSGIFLDRFGPRKTRLLSSVLFGLTFLFFLLADKDRPNLIFPGICTLSAAGLTLLLTVFQVANMFGKWKASVISLFNGAVDSSAIILLFFKLLYDESVAWRSIVIFYFLFAIILILVFTFILPPLAITSNLVENMVTESSHNVQNQHEIGANESLVEPEATQSNGKMKENEVREMNGKAKTPEKNGKPPQDLQSSPLCVSDELEDNDNIDDMETARSREDEEPRLMSLVMTGDYILAVMFLSVCNLRLWFYVGNLNSYLEFMSDGDEATINHYTNWFGIIQFAGFFFAPFVGFVMDWKPKNKRNQKTDIGFAVGFLLTSIVALLLNILVLIPTLSVQYASFVVQVVLRAFVYAVFSAFILHKFPLCHFGKLFGAGHLISAAFGSIQYGLFTVAEETLKKDPFWVNMSLLLLCLILNVLPVHLWINENRKEQKRRPRSS